MAYHGVVNLPAVLVDALYVECALVTSVPRQVGGGAAPRGTRLATPAGRGIRDGDADGEE